MLKEKEFFKFNALTEGEAFLQLSAFNQELKGLVAQKNNQPQLVTFHDRVAQHFRNASKAGILHNSSLSSLNYIHNTNEKSTVNDIIREAQGQNKPCITLSTKDFNSAIRNINSNLQGNPIDEFDPSPEQLNQCEIEASEKALIEELKNGRTFNQGTFDPSTEQVYPIGTDGRLVVIKIANLRARQQKIYDACTARLVMENIVNKKVSEAGNLAIYSVMHQQGHQITWNARVQARLYWQEQWVITTAKSTGLSERNIRLILENSAINANEETPSETIVKTGAMLIAPGSKIPTTLPPLPDAGGTPNFGGGITIPDFSDPDDIRKSLTGLVSASLASGNVALIIASVSALLIFEIINAIQKRREDIFKSIDDPLVIAARCIDANIKLEDCEGLSDDFLENNKDNNSSPSNTTAYVLGGLVLLGLGIALFSDKEEEDYNDYLV